LFHIIKKANYVLKKDLFPGDVYLLCISYC